MILITLFLSQIALCAQGAAPKNLILFELHDPRGYQQSSLEWNDKEITYITNSNFTQSAGHKALLGIFRAPLAEKEKNALAAIFKAGKKAEKNSQAFKHGIELKISGKAIPAGSEAYGLALQFMQESSRRGDWRAEDGLQVELDEKNNARLTTLSPALKKGGAKSECEQKNGGEVFCRVRPYGFARFQPEKK